MLSSILGRDAPTVASVLQRLVYSTRGPSLTRMKVIWDIDEPAPRPRQYHGQQHGDTSTGGHLPFNSDPPRTLNPIFLILFETIPTPYAQILFALFHTPSPLLLQARHQ